MSTGNILTIIGFFVTLVLAFSYVLSSYLLNYRELNSTHRQKAVTDRVVLIYNIINDTISKTSSSRINIFTTHNGSGEPTIFKLFKVSALYGSNLKEDTKLNYVDIPVDLDYTLMLQEVQVIGFKELNVSDMRGSMLKQIYLKEGINYSIVYQLAFTNIGMLYVSVAKHEDVTWTKEDRIEFDSMVRNLKIILAQEKVRRNFINWFLRFINLRR